MNIVAIIAAATALITALVALINALRGKSTSGAALTSAISAHWRLNQINAPKQPQLPTKQVPPDTKG